MGFEIKLAVQESGLRERREEKENGTKKDGKFERHLRLGAMLKTET